ncbi:putative WD40-repeat-containing domain protein [Seiridium cardinale]|uniref:WD40-repeat-containing domain protein n=1 Tax=Seiridium cardinale TaxID=138064 RepID=A0ABR2XDI8_9PEZI
MNQDRQAEIAKKRAKLLELKKAREIRQKEQRGSAGGPGDILAPTPAKDRRDIESLISSLVGERPGSTGASSPIHRASRPTSVLSAGELSGENSDNASQAPAQASAPSQPQVLTTVSLQTVYECPPSPVKEVVTYSVGAQTTEEWIPPPSRRSRAFSDLPEEDDLPGVVSTPSKRMSRRERETHEEIRLRLKKEIEEDLKREAQELRDLDSGNFGGSVTSSRFPARALTEDELQAATASDDFLDFVERSTKVIERALDEEYDILTDYTLQAQNIEDDEDQTGNTAGKGRRRVKELIQFYDDRWSKKRMVSSIDFSPNPKFPEILLASYTKNPTAPHDPDGIVQVWNAHLHNRPEYLFHAQSDILTAKFSPFHPNLIIGGTYSGQVLIWDNRAKSAPVQKTPLTGTGHSHPVYSVDIVGTQNANNVISVSTDGQLCVWSVDMLSQPQEQLTLTNPHPSKFDDVAPTTMAFPAADPTFFLVGSEEGAIYPCHRYDRAGAKAGVDTRVAYKGHSAPVMSVDFHPPRGPVDLGDLVLSSSLDWSVKLWKVRAPAATSTIVESAGNSVTPLLDLVREDVVYDAAWSPTRPGVFSLVDGAGSLEVWDLSVETEIPVAKISPTPRKEGRQLLSKSLNKVAWERHEGKRLATGGIDAAVTVFEVGPDLGGKDGAKAEEYMNVKKLVARLESAGTGSGTTA